MLVRWVAAALLFTFATTAHVAPAAATAAISPSPAAAPATITNTTADAATLTTAATANTNTTTDDTINPFLPEEQAISDCVSAVQRPGCGSDARGGWRQYVIAVLMVTGLGIIGWRIVAGVRRQPPQRSG